MVATNVTTRILDKDWAVFLMAFLVVALDQVTKVLIRMSMSPGESVPEDWPVRLSYFTNTGAAFSLFPNQTVLFIVVAFVAIAIILFYYRALPKDGNLVRVGLGLQLGGAVGNLIDRLLFGHVTDFIDLGVWPVFNFADSSIVIGVGLLAYYLLFSTPKQPAGVEGTEKPPEQ